VYDEASSSRRRKALLITAASVLCALITGAIALYNINTNPRTDDAEVFANFIGIAPQIQGPIAKLYVKDNDFVRQGDLLFEIDPRPFQYALERAKSEQAALEGQIEDEARIIASKASAVLAANAGVHSSQSNIARAAAAVEEAKADVEHAKAGVERAQAEYSYAANNLHRLEPLLVKQFVTVDQVDQARSLEAARAQAVQQAKSQLLLSQAHLQALSAQYEQAQAGLNQSKAQYEQAQHAVTTLEPLVAQREGRSSAILNAQYDLNNTRVYAPFNARVTNLTISEGNYAHVGEHLFTLIDTRTWWVIGNFRETQLKYIKPGMHADVYLMSKPNQRLDGVVDSIGFGVTPDADVVGKLNPTLPDVQRTLNWVHLASRFPVRVKVTSPDADLLRMGESAVVIIRK
jgi:multidrug efflux system membrane fusion protein